MSIKVMTQVWEHAEVSGGALLVLLALADFSNDRGESWPSVKTLAQKARLSERQTQSVIRELCASGLLDIDSNVGPHGTNIYTVLVGGAKTAGVQSDAGGGAVQRTEGVKPTAPEPSYNRQGTVKRRAQGNLIDWKRYKRSDESNDDRPPDALVEVWLVKEMAEVFGARLVAKHLERCELFFVWRKIKQYLDDGEHGTLKALMPRAQIEYQAEVDQIYEHHAMQTELEDTPGAKDHHYRMAEIYAHIRAKGQADLEAEYAVWEQENYPAVTGAK